MRPWLSCAATIAWWMLVAATPATAGYWNYGRKGSLGDTPLTFDRNTFLIMPKALATGGIAGLAKSDIFAFDANDNNSGFMTTMKFARGAYPDQKIVLTENHRKKSPNKKAMSAAARRRRQRFRKHLITSGSAGAANPR